MTIDMEKLRQEIEFDEGCKLDVYVCSEGHRTVGIGHLIRETDEEINYESEMRSHLRDASRCLLKMWRLHVEIVLNFSKTLINYLATLSESSLTWLSSLVDRASRSSRNFVQQLKNKIS